jgi:hypothetical protein
MQIEKNLADDGPARIKAMYSLGSKMKSANDVSAQRHIATVPTACMVYVGLNAFLLPWFNYHEPLWKKNDLC